MTIIGVSVILGLMVPTYMKDNEHALNTGTHICHYQSVTLGIEVSLSRDLLMTLCCVLQQMQLSSA